LGKIAENCDHNIDPWKRHPDQGDQIGHFLSYILGDSLLWVFFIYFISSLYFGTTFFHGKSYVLILTQFWHHIWPVLSQTHLVTLRPVYFYSLLPIAVTKSQGHHIEALSEGFFKRNCK
jgi:hypothetical protein